MRTKEIYEQLAKDSRYIHEIKDAKEAYESLLRKDKEFINNLGPLNINQEMLLYQILQQRHLTESRSLLDCIPSKSNSFREFDKKEEKYILSKIIGHLDLCDDYHHELLELRSLKRS
ncbi:MAG: hypothetical protein QT05_C0050G0034 [archaeon GW2011_AR13]|nr:MAG: hypothetical protein QT05_C0050G0034 [archaeon GW2011_AR13]HIG95118.1 hypothetical protein [Nanoarchaeota archaeon]HIH63200.1 hypothetical protein [Nanoarchaeota archaeon]HIJ09304.1 hypothetical protein [Nanoarchaeota archaeon]